MEPRTPGWAPLFFSQWPACPAWSQTLVSLARRISSLQLAESQPEGFTWENYSDPVRDTQLFHTVSASLGKKGKNHQTEYTLPLLLLFSLCVLRVTMVPAQISTTSSRFESGRNACPFFTRFCPSLMYPFSLGCTHIFQCQEIPSCTQIHSAVFFHCWGISRQGLCIYVIHVKKLIVSYSIPPE